MRMTLHVSAIIVGIGLLSPGIPTQVSADPGIPRARQRAVPVAVPIGCLMTRACLEGAGFEAARKGNAVTVSESASSRSGVQNVTSSDPAVFGVNAADAALKADALLETVRGELLAVPRADLFTQEPLPVVHGIIGIIPDPVQVRLAEYANSDDFFACVLVFRAMRKANADIQDKTAQAKVLWDLYQRYIDNCHKGTLDVLGEARDRLVVFVRKDIRDKYYAYCLGFNFAANYVLTAHHCLVEPGEIDLMVSRFKPSDPDAFIVVDGPQPRSRALVIGEPGKLYALRVPEKISQELNFFPFELDRDAVVLELDTPDRGAMPAFPVAKPTEWDRIAVPALFVEDDVLSKAIESGRSDLVTQAIAEASAVDISPLCSLVYSSKSNKPFVFHGCQTRYGYSGAPILRRDNNGKTVLVGVHTGSVDRNNAVDGWPYQALFPNYGLRLPDLFWLSIPQRLK
jgi:hypothetical protein